MGYMEYQWNINGISMVNHLHLGILMDANGILMDFS